MSNKFEATWEAYTSSWKAESVDDKRIIFGQCLDLACVYNDPIIKTKGWDALLEYMIDFHKQIPGGHFVTKYFLAHSNKSISKWDMKNGDNTLLGEGISYSEYNKAGKLVSMTGFFETPEA
ncbi:MAG: nuclear transport factor 2 family protein [Gammaproteobacteria bacterium]|nr:nuclear transport factor 2 family protein [Gammaproteobacteria bacterium]